MQVPGINDLILKNVKKERYQKYAELMPDFKSEKNGKIITIALTLSISIILIIFVINPTFSVIAGLQKQLSDDKFLEQKMQEKIQDLASLQQQYQKIENDLPLVYDAVPQTSEVPKSLALIQAAANQSGVSVTNLQAYQVEISKDAQINKQYSSYEINFLARGDYQSLINFLGTAVNFQRILKLESVTISKSTDTKNQALILNIKCSAYFKE